MAYSQTHAVWAKQAMLGRVGITFVWSLDCRWICYGTIFFMTIQITPTRIGSSFTAVECSVTTYIPSTRLSHALVCADVVESKVLLLHIPPLLHIPLHPLYSDICHNTIQTRCLHHPWLNLHQTSRASRAG